MLEKGLAAVVGAMDGSDGEMAEGNLGKSSGSMREFSELFAGTSVFLGGILLARSIVLRLSLGLPGRPLLYLFFCWKSSRNSGCWPGSFLPTAEAGPGG